MERDTTYFIAFLEEVTHRQGKTFIRNQLLPRRVAGFRDGHAPISRTVPILISKLKREQELTNPDSHIWDMFSNAWKFWVESHTELNEILLEFDNSADFDENQRCIVPPNSELDIQCFHALLDANGKSKIDQETIQRFYEYGYFKKDEQIESIINKALPREEIERRQRIEQLPDQIDRIRQEIDELRTQFSDLELTDELQQVLDQRITEVQQSFNKQFSKLKFSQNVSEIKQLINTLKSRIGEVENTLKSRIDELENSLPETQPAINESINSIEVAIAQLEQQIQNTNQSVEERLGSMDSSIAEIKSMAEGLIKPTVPKIADKAKEIGRDFETKLTTETRRYSNEEKYLENMALFLPRFGLTNSENRDESTEIAAAIHVAIKAFPALEIADERLIKIWQLICCNHLHVTKINVELGWFGKQDWFPDLFSEECFDKRLEKIDLEISIREMLKTGDMPWLIHLNNCDKSYPDSYLPSFLDWIRELCGDSIRVFLTRCSGANRCATSWDVYERVARLPKPHKPRPINVRHLGPQYVVPRREWISWCSPNTGVDLPSESQLHILDQLQTITYNMGVQLPEEFIPEIQHYIRLSHDILAPTYALDWALTLRFLPWIENQPQIIESVLSMQDLDDNLQHFREGLQQAREKANESN